MIFIIKQRICTITIALLFLEILQAGIYIETVKSLEDLALAKPIYTAAFLESYKNISDNEIGVPEGVTRPEAFNRFFDSHVNIFASNQNIHHAIIAKNDSSNAIVGLLMFDQEADGVYIKILVVDPAAQKQGIGKLLTQTVLDMFPNDTRFTLITRTFNTIARTFYAQLGFKETSCTRPGHKAELYVGFEKVNISATL